MPVKIEQIMETTRLIFKRLNFSFEHESPEDFVVSQWQNNKKCLLWVIYRWIIASFFVFSVATSITYAILRNQVLVYFIYLTNWNLNFTMVMTCMSAWNSTMFYKDRLDLKQSMTKKLKIFWFLSTTTTMYAIIISVVYWTILYKQEKTSIDFNNVIIHATNSIVLVTDLFVVKNPARFGIYIYPFACGLLYLFFSWLYPFLGGVDK